MHSFNKNNKFSDSIKIAQCSCACNNLLGNHDVAFGLKQCPQKAALCTTGHYGTAPKGRCMYKVRERRGGAQ